jgi:hypothetical protein
MKHQTIIQKQSQLITRSHAVSNRRAGLILIALAFAWSAVAPQARALCQEGCDGFGNTFLNDDGLFNNTACCNTAVGSGTLALNISGYNNTAIGYQALNNSSYGVFNTATGSGALAINYDGYNNTATGSGTLGNNGSGDDNTATGFDALSSNTDGNDNTANGAYTLFSNTTGSYNTASGWSALISNTTGSDNTANGLDALFSNTTGNSNTAIGFSALITNTTGSENTANGFSALDNNTTGSDNTAEGFDALFSNTTGNDNTANGFDALYSNTTGNDNMGNGFGALFSNTTGVSNTANGFDALGTNTTGSNNIAIGASAGNALTTGSSNIEIGNVGVRGESKTIRIGKSGTQRATFIAGISGAIVPTGVAVIVDSSGHLGTTTSSARFKEAIQPMDGASEAILSLQPVTFRYKKELDPSAIPQFGLVAEQVEKVAPDLVARDEQGKPYSVRYEAVNAMLLNEFLKEHRKVESLEQSVAEQREQIKALTGGLQKVSNELELTKPSARVVANGQ